MQAVRDLILPVPDAGVSPLELHPADRVVRVYAALPPKSLFTKEPPTPQVIVTVMGPDEVPPKPERRYYVLAMSGQAVPDGARYCGAVPMGPITCHLIQIPHAAVGELRAWVKSRDTAERGDA